MPEIKLPDKATQDTINTNIGTSSATASSSGTSLFALIKYIVSMLTGTWTSTKAGYLDASVSTRATQTSVDAISLDISSIKESDVLSNYGVVKSIRRGSSKAETAGGVVKVTLSNINPSKTMVLIDSRCTYRYNTSVSITQAYLISLVATQATFSSHDIPTSATSGNFDKSPETFYWQIIEFY